MTTSSCLEEKWWQNSLAPLKGVGVSQKIEGVVFGAAFLKGIVCFSHVHPPFFFPQRAWVFLGGSLEDVKVGKGGGTGKSWHKPRTEVLREAGKDQGTPALEPLELQNPSLLGGAAEDRPILSLVFLWT